MSEVSGTTDYKQMWQDSQAYAARLEAELAEARRELGKLNSCMCGHEGCHIAGQWLRKLSAAESERDAARAALAAEREIWEGAIKGWLFNRPFVDKHQRDMFFREMRTRANRLRREREGGRNA